MPQMEQLAETEYQQTLAWCTATIGPFEFIADHSKVHDGHASATYRLRTTSGYCYLKIHASRAHWNQEVHAYEQWAGVFGDHTPRLLAVRDEEPLALVISEIPGQIAETAHLSPSQERDMWRSAGAALVVLHSLEAGRCFGPCHRDGSCTGSPIEAVEAFVATKLKNKIERAANDEYLHDGELALLNVASDLVTSFAGERPLPCHRDYCTANWLVNSAGVWSGVIDFEFAHWDVRVADFSRDPTWSWLHRPELIDAFFEGYGRALTPNEEQQCFVARAEYALDAILWGRDYAFFGFEREGHAALAHLAGLSA